MDIKMPRSLQKVTKRSRRAKAARARFANKREALKSVTYPRTNNLQGSNSNPPNRDMLFEDRYSAPLQTEIEIKEEPLDIVDTPTQLQTLDEDVELPGPENSEDPIELDPGQLLLPLENSTLHKDNDDNDRCRFCLQFIRQVDAQHFVLRQRVISVLGTSTGRYFAHAVTVKCCKRCKNMIDQFYEFKQISVAALIQSEKLLNTIGGCQKTRLTEKSNTKDVSSRADEVNSTNQLPPGSDLGVSSPEIMPMPTVEDHPDSPHVCDRCAKRFATKTCYIRHKPFCTKETKPAKPPKTPQISIQCPLCPKKFRNPKTFTLHSNWHNRIQTIPCRREGCDKMFFTTYDRQKHEEICGQDAKVLCYMCGALFLTEVYLRHHLVIHGDPQFTCEVCHKEFRRKKALIKHVTVHSDERKYKCEVCGKRFKSGEANRVHQRIHTQEKPYVCQVCGERFRLNCLLKAHLEKVHGTVGENPKEAQSKSEN